MRPVDVILISPPASRLIDILTEATAAGNQGSNILPLGRSHWEELVPLLRSEREGRKQWSDTARGERAFVSLTWWTDHIARRHWRIRGGRVSDRGAPRLIPLRQDRRPPVWHVYPDRIFLLCDAGRSRWLAACACGACDEPAELAWDGHSCGACHDRRCDGELPPLQPGQEPRTSFRASQQGIATLAYSPEGRTLASSSASGVLLWDLASGEYQGLPGLRLSPAGLAFSPDGQLLAAGDDSGGMAILELASNELCLGGDYVTCLTFDPSGLTLAVGGLRGLELWERQGRRAPWRQSLLPEEFVQPGGVTAVGFNALGDLLAVGGPDQPLLVRVADKTALPCRGTPPAPGRREVLALAFARDGSLRAVLGPGRRSPFGQEEQEFSLAVFAVAEDGLVFSSMRPLPPLSRATFSPDGEALAWLPLPARGEHAVHVGLLAPGRSTPCTLGWDLEEPLNCVAFAPDGETLATGGAAGTIKLWPWRQLVEG
jgi:WD40 repeat protein